jgi:hypothetical protein
MSTQTVTTEVITPVVEQPNPRKFSRKVDVPGGNPQIYYGATEQELSDNMATAIQNGTLKIRELSRKTTLETPTFAAPEGADQFEDIPEPNFRDLTPEERTAIAAKFAKPETVVEGFDELYKARTGLDPQQSGKTQVQQARDAAQVKALNAARLFMERHPDFVPCEENRDALHQFLATRKIPPTLKNFELAYGELSANGLLVLATPEVEPPAPPVEAAPVEPVRTEPVEEPAQSVIPSALTRRSASGGETPARKKGPTPAELAMMSAGQLKAHYEATGQWPKK